MTTDKQIPCELCSEPTIHLQTKLCNTCYDHTRTHSEDICHKWVKTPMGRQYLLDKSDRLLQIGVKGLIDKIEKQELCILELCEGIQQALKLSEQLEVPDRIKDLLTATLSVEGAPPPKETRSGIPIKDILAVLDDMEAKPEMPPNMPESLAEGRKERARGWNAALRMLRYNLMEGL